MNTYTLNLKPLAKQITVEHFEQLCALNPELKLEINHQGKLIVMSPTGYETGMNNASLIAQFWIWNRQYDLGVVCDSSTGFILPNGAVRSPDLSWIVKERIARFSQEEKARFLPLTPDFILELMSPSDLLEIVQDKMTSDPLKGSTVPTTEETSATDCLTAPSYGARERARMQEYQDNGVKLGWLINPQRQQVAVYRPQQVTEIMDSPATLSGEAVLPDLVVELDFIWR